MKKVPGHGYVRQTARPAGPPIDYSPMFYSRIPPFLIGKAIIGWFSNKESTSEGA